VPFRGTGRWRAPRIEIDELPATGFTERDDVAVSGQTFVAVSGQTPLSAHNKA